LFVLLPNRPVLLKCVFTPDGWGLREEEAKGLQEPELRCHAEIGDAGVVTRLPAAKLNSVCDLEQEGTTNATMMPQQGISPRAMPWTKTL
jgi:hypothetical protein